MARDPRKNSAFASGMRGKDKPKVEGNTGGDRGARGPDGSSGSESKQTGGKTVGDSAGVDLSAYTSGMRGIEKPKQKDAATEATYGQTREGKSQGAGSTKQGPDRFVGNPDGEQSWSSDDTGPKKGIKDAVLQKKVTSTRGLGIPGNNTEAAAAGHQPSGEGILGEEDDTHINIRIPKASLKKKNPGLQTN